MKKTISELQERVNQAKIAADLVSLLKESQAKLLEANSMLFDDIKLLKQAQADKDKLWELELEDIQNAMNLIKINKNV